MASRLENFRAPSLAPDFELGIGMRHLAKQLQLPLLLLLWAIVVV